MKFNRLDRRLLNSLKNLDLKVPIDSKIINKLIQKEIQQDFYLNTKQKSLFDYAK